ncbi:P-loop NTPase fold protein [Aquimarina sp. SS2-1]|uniref:KAP family P-loop NTPase fold protein n=1 Tax=Aquimarina besae TaxID=3342247 RepID=UPI00366FA70C
MDKSKSLKHRLPPISKKNVDNPFEYCKLDREQYAEVLTSIVHNYSDGFVLAINNKWGTGKTTFIKMWRQYLIKKEFRTLYFNAWENDFQNEVLIALISELKELKNNDEETFKKILSKTVPLVKKMAPAMLKHFAEKAVGEGTIAEIIKAAGDYGVNELEAEILSFNKKKNSIRDFREILENFVKEVDPTRPVIFIIDELDRCKPSYAVEVLEQIKHLFAVPGIVFVLSIDKEQLGHAIRGYYGSDKIDADEYLRRFIDIEYSIPNPNVQKYIEYLYSYYDYNSIFPGINHDVETFKTLARLIFKRANYSLREIEKVFIKVKLIISSFRNETYVFPEVILFLYHLREKYPDKYKLLKNGVYSYQAFHDTIEDVLNELSNPSEIRRVQSLLASLLYHYSYDYERLYRVNKDTKIIERDIKTLENELKLTIITDTEDDSNSVANLISSLHKKDFLHETKFSDIVKKFELIDKVGIN